MSYTNFNDSIMELCNLIGGSCLEYISSDDEDTLVRMDAAVEAAAQLIYASNFVMAEITCFAVSATYGCMAKDDTRTDVGEYLGLLNAAAQQYILEVDAKKEEVKEEGQTPAEKSDDIIFLDNCLSIS